MAQRDNLTQPEVDAVICAVLEGMGRNGYRERFLGSLPLAQQVEVTSAESRHRAWQAQQARNRST